MVTYPSDWATYPFERFFTLLPNNTLSRDKLSSVGEIGNIHYGDVLIKYGDIITDKDAIPRIKDDAGYIPKCFLQKNDVILADTAEDEAVGKVSQIGDIAIPLVGGLHTIVCRPLIDTADGYLGYYMNSQYYHSQLLPYITGIKVSSISKKSLEQTELHIPSKVSEQAAIVSVIAAFDTHIENLSALIEKKCAVRDGALADLISGRTRLAGFNEAWSVKDISALTQEIITGGTPSTNRPEYWDGDIPWLSSTEIHQKQITTPTRNITVSGLYNSSSKIAPKGSVILALAGQGKTRGTVAMLMSPMALNQSLAALIASNITDEHYLYYVFEANYTLLRELSSGDGGRGGLSKKLIRQLSFKVPEDTKEQVAIASILVNMDAEITALKAERDKMAQIREGAMDDLLTGRVRLKV